MDMCGVGWVLTVPILLLKGINLALYSASLCGVIYVMVSPTVSLALGSSIFISSLVLVFLKSATAA